MKTKMKYINKAVFFKKQVSPNGFNQVYTPCPASTNLNHQHYIKINKTKILYKKYSKWISLNIKRIIKYIIIKIPKFKRTI